MRWQMLESVRVMLGPKVRVVPCQPHCFAFGGFELQMIAALQAVREIGVDAMPLDFWKREADFDVLHLWGLELQHSNTVRWASADRKKVVVSALLNYPSWKSWLQHLGYLMPGGRRLRRAMLQKVDCVTVVNAAQAQYLVNTIGFPEGKVEVVPNIVEDVFFCGGSRESSVRADVYVVSCGSVCRRKNQLALISACQKLGIRLLLVGKVLTGEEDYGKAVEEAISGHDSICWIKGLRPGSTELAEVYRCAAVFALPSYVEQQPISALEAAAVGLPLVLADRPYAKQEFYAHAAVADPDSVDAIAKTLHEVLMNPDAYCAPRAVIERCRRGRVGAAYGAIYERLNEQKSGGRGSE